jgi:hypothetical protein
MQAQQYNVVIDYHEVDKDILGCLEEHERKASATLTLTAHPAAAARIDAQLLHDEVQMDNQDRKTLELRIMASDAFGNPLTGAPPVPALAEVRIPW